MKTSEDFADELGRLAKHLLQQAGAVLEGYGDERYGYSTDVSLGGIALAGRLAQELLDARGTVIRGVPDMVKLLAHNLAESSEELVATVDHLIDEAEEADDRRSRAHHKQASKPLLSDLLSHVEMVCAEIGSGRLTIHHSADNLVQIMTAATALLETAEGVLQEATSAKVYVSLNAIDELSKEASDTLRQIDAILEQCCADVTLDKVEGSQIEPTISASAEHALQEDIINLEADLSSRFKALEVKVNAILETAVSALQKSVGDLQGRVRNLETSMHFRTVPVYTPPISDQPVPESLPEPQVGINEAAPNFEAEMTSAVTDLNVIAENVGKFMQQAAQIKDPTKL